MTAYNLLIILIIMIKVIFVLLKLTAFYNRITGKSETEFGHTILFWADRVEFIFIFLMSILLIALFRNAVKEGVLCIYDKETLILMYIFGFILLLTADWGTFFSESAIINKIQEIFGIKKEETKETTTTTTTNEPNHNSLYRSW